MAMAEIKLSRFHYDERSQLWLEPFSELINGLFPIEQVYGDWNWWHAEREARLLFNPESLCSSSSSYLPTGSRAEGFCIPRLLYSDREGDVPLHERKSWTPDLDEMKVEECFIEDENNKSIAIFTPEHVSDDPRYVYLRFTDEWKEAKPRYKNAEFVNHTFLVPSDWFPGFVGQGWTYEMHGPVRKLQRAQNDSGFVAGIEEDQTGVFKYPLAWPKEAMEWIIRPRQNAWPSPELLQSIIESGCHLAPVGRGKRQKELLEYIDYDKSPAQASTSSRNDQDSQDLSKMDETEWRLSFSVAENKLGESVSPVQRHVLVLLKMIKKVYFPDVISSYHLKNLLFWEIEKQDKSFWMESNMSSCLLLILDRLQKSVEEGYLPHYIIPTSNLFCSEDPSELTQAAAVISDVRVNILPKTVSLLKRCLSMTYLTETFMKDLNDLETLVEKLHDKSLKEDDVAELMSLLLGVFIEKNREVLETIYQEQSRQPEEERKNAETIKQMLLVPLSAYQSLLARSLCKAWYLKHNKTKENPSSHDFASFVKDEVNKLPLDDTFFDLTNLYFTEVRENRDMSLMIPYTSAMKTTKESHRKVAWKQVGDVHNKVDQEIMAGSTKSDLQEISKRLEEKFKCQNLDNVTIEGIRAAVFEGLQLLVSRKK